jgi:drug/metabolite transporter (DMT)-like permease
MTPPATGSQWKVGLAFAAVYIIWGSTYLAILICIKTVPPLLMIAIRFAGAGILLFTWRYFKKDKVPGLKSFLQNSLTGILTLFGGVGSVGWAEQYISSSLAAIIVTAIPFWFVLFDRRQWSFYFNNKIILGGLLFGFAGVAILVGFSHPGQEASVKGTYPLIASLVIMAGGIAWTSGSLYSKYTVTGNSILMNASIQFLVAGLFSAIMSFATGEWSHFSFGQVSNSSWLALFYLTTMGSLVAYLAYIWLLEKRPAAQVSTYVYVNPVIALLLGAWIAKEKISWIQVTALAVILCGVVMVNLPKYRKQSTTH